MNENNEHTSEVTGTAREVNALAVNFMQQGEIQQAMDLFESALEILPDSPLIMNNLANACQKMGDYDRAQDLYRKTIELRPDYPHPYRNLAIIYSIAGTYEFAIRAYQHYLALEPEDAEVLFNLGLLYMQLGEVLKAEKCFAGVIEKLEEKGVDNYQSLAIAHMLSGDFNKAGELFKRIIKLDPENKIAQYNYALLQFAEFDAQSAQASLESLYSNEQDQSGISVAIAVALASLYLCNDQADKAQSILRPLADKNIIEPAVYMNLGYAARQKKEYEQAYNYYRRVLSVCEPGTFFYKKASDMISS